MICFGWVGGRFVHFAELRILWDLSQNINQDLPINEPINSLKYRSWKINFDSIPVTIFIVTYN